jgi:hypothetical protein
VLVISNILRNSTTIVRVARCVVVRKSGSCTSISIPSAPYNI